jgi:hypothetical protein
MLRSIVSRQLVQVNSCQIHAAETAAPIIGVLNGLRKTLFDALKVCVEVKGAPFFEGHFQLHGWQVGRDASARYGLHQGCPYVGTEEGRGDVRVVDVEERGGEGLEVFGLLGGEVDDLGWVVREWKREGAG